MNRLFILLCFLFLFSGIASADEKTATPEETKNVLIVKEMFSEFAEKLDITKLDTYYSKDFILESNGKQYSYIEYKNLEKNIFQMLKNLKVTQYNDIFSSSNKVTSRMTIKLTHKDGKTIEFQVILVALIKEGKIDKLWELTYPSWSDKLSQQKKTSLIN